MEYFFFGLLLTAAVAWASRRFAALAQRLQLLEREQRLFAHRLASLVSAMPLPPTTAVPRPTAASPGASQQTATGEAAPPSGIEAPPISGASGSAVAAARIDWERFVGVKLFAWLGGFALFLSAAFALRFLFEHGLAPPGARAVGGFLFGAGLIAGGVAVRRDYRVTSQTLCASGVVILYSVSFASHAWYHLGFFGVAQTFFIMALTTAAAIVLAVRLEGPVIAILGILGGFLTPALLSTGENNPLILFGYVALLQVGLLAVIRVRRWDYLAALAAGGTIVTEFAWQVKFFTPAQVGAATAIFLFFPAFYCAALLLAKRQGWLSVTLAFSGAAPAVAAVAAGFAFSWNTGLADHPAGAFVVPFGANFILLLMASLVPRLRAMAILGRGFLFVLLAGWGLEYASVVSLRWALGFCLLFAALQTFAPALMRRRPEGGATPAGVGGLETLTAALSSLVPFVLLASLSFRFGLENASWLFGTALLLGVFLTGLGRLTEGWVYHAAGAMGLVLTQGAWLAGMPATPQPWETLGWNVGFLLAYSAYPFVVERRAGPGLAPWATAAAFAVAQFCLTYALAKKSPWQAFMAAAPGVIPTAFAVATAASLYALARVIPPGAAHRPAAQAWFGGVVLFFITAAGPIQLSHEWLTISWALEGAALCWLFHRLPQPGLRAVGVGLLMAAFGRLSLNPSVLKYHARSGHLFNWILPTYGIAATCQFLASRLLAPPRDRIHGLRAPPWLQAAGVTLAFILLNLEIADFFGSGPVVTFDFSGNLARDMSYTIGWAAFAFGLVSGGLLARNRAARFAGSGLLGVALTKLFLHDLSALGQLYRVGALAAVAAIAIVASYLFQRFFSTRASERQA